MRRTTLLVVSALALPGFARAYYAEFVQPSAPPPVSEQRQKDLVKVYHKDIMGGQIIALKDDQKSMCALNHIDIGALGGVKAGDVFAVYSPSGKPVGFIRVIQPSRYTSSFEFVELTIPPSKNLTVKKVPDSVREQLPPGLRVEPKFVASAKKKGKGVKKTPATPSTSEPAKTDGGLPPLPGTVSGDDTGLPALPGAVTPADNTLPPLPGANAQPDGSLPPLPGAGTQANADLPPLPMGEGGTPASGSDLPPMPEMALPASKPPQSLADVGALPPPDFPSGGPDGLPGLEDPMMGGVPALPGMDMAPPPGLDMGLPTDPTSSLPGLDLAPPPGLDLMAPPSATSSAPALPGLDLAPPPGLDLMAPPSATSSAPALPGLDLAPPPGMDLMAPPATTSAIPELPGLDLAPPPGV